MVDLSESLEARRLLNPAFCGLLVALAAVGHQRESSAGLPFLYGFLVLPFVLHAETRSKIPAGVSTKLATWAERNPSLVALYARRLNDLAPAAREGVLLACMSGLLSLDDSATLVPSISSKAVKGYEAQPTSTSEVLDCMKRATFIGRWLAGAGTQATVLAILGVRL